MCHLIFSIKYFGNGKKIIIFDENNITVDK